MSTRENLPFENTQDIHLTAALLVTYGRWWVGLSKEQLEQLTILASNTRPDLGLCGLTEHNRSMLSKFRDHDLAQQLLWLPDTLRRRYVAAHNPQRRDHDLMQDAAMIAIQLSTAVRPKNAATTRIGVHLLDRKGQMILHYPASEVKNRVPLEFVLPQHTASVVRDYIRLARPQLAKPDSDYLFPGQRGGHLGIGYFGQKVGDVVQREIGVRVTAHRFRHVCGFLYLQDNPNGYEVVRLLLGHKKISTTLRYYAGAEVEEAHRRYDTYMEQRRERIAPPPVLTRRRGGCDRG